MKRKILSPVKIWIAGIATAIVLGSATLSDDFFEISKNIEIFTSLYKELNIYYVDQAKPGALMKTGIDAMLRSLDPYTVYYPESKIEDFRFMTTGQYGGIGALVNTINDKITITEPYEGYPAAKAGLKAGDELLKVDGKSVEGKKQEDVTEIMTGQPGTEVELTIRREGQPEPMIFKIKREEVKIPDVPYFAMLDAQTGYIKLTGFTQTASSDVRNAFNELKRKNMNRVILDLRGNGGGLLREAVNIVNFFVPKGTEIVKTKGKIAEWNKTYSALNEPLDTTIPIIILVDDMSASASEVVSGSLQDLDRAVVVGSESYGKGLVQQTKDLSYNTKLKLTVAKYYTPSGRCIQRLDYSHRDAETGKVVAVSDSLIKPFKTMNGRTVYDGRGISPDVVVEPEDLSNILGGLASEWITFKWATKYQLNHSAIDSADVFRLTEEEYAAFVEYASQQEFDYKTNTEALYKELKKVAEEEKYYTGAENEFNQLLAKIEPSKEQDLIKFKGQIKPFLENEIVSRYYYQNGRIQNSLPEDPCIIKAGEVFNSNYSQLLEGPGTPRK